MTQRIDRGLNGILGFVGWLFSKPALGVDLGLLAFAAGWVLVLIVNPEIMDSKSFALLKIINREAWVSIFSVVAFAHAVGMASPWRMRRLRVMAMLASGWLWLTIGSTFAPHMTTGAPTYIIIGFGALLTALYVTRLRE